jgi:hypothetical protein
LGNIDARDVDAESNFNSLLGHTGRGLAAPTSGTSAAGDFLGRVNGGDRGTGRHHAEPAGLALARKVGVQQPEKIRVVRVQEIPMPRHGPLRAAAVQVGFGPDLTGLTLGHAIFLCEHDQRLQLLAHECRHVAQYESFGSIAAFLTKHLRDVATVGYYNSPLERDARACENYVP